jgi:hypothetical protein
MRRSLRISLTAIFAALHAVLYLTSFGLWRNWAIYIAPIEGILLGPYTGFFAALLGSSVGRTIKPDMFWMFGIIAEPFSVLMAGFLARAKWKPVLAAYAIMLAAYFIHPFGRTLPLWTILDILLALVLVYPVAKLGKNLFKIDSKRMPFTIALISFVSTAADSLARVFLLVPCNLYSLFPDVFGGFETLYVIFVTSALSSYIEDLIVVTVSLVVGVPLMIALSKTGIFGNDNNKKADSSSLQLS